LFTSPCLPVIHDRLSPVALEYKFPLPSAFRILVLSFLIFFLELVFFLFWTHIQTLSLRTMSDTREIPTVVVTESEEEELLSEDEVVPEQVERQMLLVPLDHRGVSKVGTGDEFHLRNNYDIPPTVLLHFQNPVTREIRGGDLFFYEKMLLAGLRFPLPDIARELVLFLGVSPSQLIPNAWRYLLASFILW
jgi:hypothetical protein